MRVARIADQAPAPWRNGRGVTRDLGHGEGWRLSLAEIDSAGPFSRFPGLERWFAVASGAVRLRFESGLGCELHAASAPIAFPGEDAPHCEPSAGHGACRALNLMVAREAWRGGLERRALRAGATLRPGEHASALAVFVQRGRVAPVGERGAPLAPGDAIFLHCCASGHEAATLAAPRATRSPVLEALDDDTMLIVALRAPAAPRAPVAGDPTES